MVTKSNETLLWAEVDTTTFGGELAKSYAAYKTAMDKAKGLREEFEGRFTKAAETAKKVPAGQEVRFGYKWGKLSIAFGAKTEVKTAGKFSL